MNTSRDILKDGLAADIGGWVGPLLDACLQNGLMTDNYRRFAAAWSQKMDSDGAFHGEFWGKWFTGAALGGAYRPTAENMALLQNAVDLLLDAQEADGRLAASAADLTTWDLWGRKYALLGLVAWYDLTGEQRALDGAAKALDAVIACTRDAGVKITETGLAALQAASSCSILQPVVQIYAATGEQKYLDYAKWIVALWSEGSAYNPRGMRLIEDALAGLPPVAIAAPKGYEVMSCWEGVCELYRVTGEQRLLDAVLAYMEGVQRREVMLTGSGSSGELWCEGATRQTQLLEAPMETCVTATYMKLCHQLLRLTGDARWADQLEVSLFNALAGAMEKDGSWWAYFSPLQGQRVPSQVQLPAMNSSCCVVNGPRALMEVPGWAVMDRAGDCTVNLYQPGSYRCGAWLLEQHTAYPADGNITITIKEAPAGEATLTLRVPAWSQGSTVCVGSAPCPAPAGWYNITRCWQPGDTVTLTLDVSPRIVDAPASAVHKALMAGPVVLALDEAHNPGLPLDLLWLMNDGMELVHDDQLGMDYYRAQSLEQQSHRPIATPVQLPDARMGWHVSFLKKPVHFFDHEVKELVFCDYASCGGSLKNASPMRVWLPQPMYGQEVFLQGTKKVVNPFIDENETL